MKTKIYEIEYTKKSKTYYGNGETIFHLLNSLGEIVTVVIDHGTDREDIKECFGKH